MQLVVQPLDRVAVEDIKQNCLLVPAAGFSLNGVGQGNRQAPTAVSGIDDEAVQLRGVGRQRRAQQAHEPQLSPQHRAGAGAEQPSRRGQVGRPKGWLTRVLSTRQADVPDEPRGVVGVADDERSPRELITLGSQSRLLQRLEGPVISRNDLWGFIAVELHEQSRDFWDVGWCGRLDVGFGTLREHRRAAGTARTVAVDRVRAAQDIPTPRLGGRGAGLRLLRHAWIRTSKWRRWIRSRFSPATATGGP